jgi:cytochrome c
MGIRTTAFCTAVLLASVAMTPRQASASAELAAKAGCSGCHATDKKLFGPSYTEIAARYAGNPKAAALLVERVRKGSKGVWGPAPMQPIPAARISDSDLTAVIAWILKP